MESMAHVFTFIKGWLINLEGTNIQAERILSMTLVVLLKSMPRLRRALCTQVREATSFVKYFENSSIHVLHQTLSPNGDHHAIVKLIMLLGDIWSLNRVWVLDLPWTSFRITDNITFTSLKLRFLATKGTFWLPHRAIERINSHMH